MEKEKLKLDPALMQALKFTEADLKANRAGRLSKRQQARLMEAYRRRSMSLVGIVFLGIIIAVGLIVTLERHGWPRYLMGAVVGVSTLTYALYVLRQLRRQFVLDIQQSIVAAVKGSVQCGDSPEAEYLIKLNHESWGVQEHVFRAFKNGDPYAIYYAPHSKTILSAEWLRER